MEASKYMMPHPQGTSDLRILFKEYAFDNIEGYTDSDWVGDNEGGCLHCGRNHTNNME